MSSLTAVLLILLQVLANPAPGGVPAESGPCGTPARMEAFRLIGPAGYSSANRPSLSGTEQTLDSPGGNFKIHWTNSGSDSTTYGYALSIALAADSSWAVQCDQMGFFEPPPDNGVGGDDLYDIYIVQLTGGVIGYASCAGEYQPPDSTHDCSASHIVVHNYIEDLGQRNCVVAHEFQHAIQASYDYNEAIWFLENCAVWATEMVYPDVDDYLGCIASGDNALRTPWLDIRSYSYGGFPWVWMMWDRWGYESVRDIWDYCAAEPGANTLSAHDSMFADRGVTFEEFFMDYGVWRWFTAANWYEGCGMFCQESSTWLPGPRVLPWHEITELPFTGDQTPYFPPDRFGIHWIRVDLAGYQDGWIEMDFDGRDGFHWNLGVILQDLSGDHYFHWYQCDPVTGDRTVSVNADGWDCAVFFPAFMDLTSLDHLYEFTVDYTSGMEGSPETGERPGLALSSNPMGRGGTVDLTLPETGMVRLEVYDVTGRLARTLLREELEAGCHTIRFEDSDLAPGTYFVVLSTGGSSFCRKVVLVR